MKILIAYYSRTGNTRATVEKVSSFLGELSVTKWEIPEKGSRKGMRGWLKSCLEGARRRESSISPPPFEVRDFDLVILGTPVWANSPASAVRAFCRTHGKEFRKVAFLGTHGGGGTAKTFTQLAELCGKKPLATLSLRDKAIKEDDREGFDVPCEAFAQSIREKLESPADDQ